ncbi:helix-turn-helix transcriptional regulator [Hyphomonas sp.]|jgi:transcriptional regulator with XRE-family HTH domain|uniref:helix-turn-helix domain-containing protein n=1 Tax=Hyphomonas sp. TaxID=87 RepID=UPI000C46908F|nr:helix-turn-helix transcriptional regulator [Hyphomonas sp.]MAB11804.1 transcriptional regulator [Hyphomonas sp.]MAU66679.1 transcriptional regulator [Hyphomonas sp.]MBM57010.1 transcriptional regulator [Hyphomonas sp.]|tara:strand:- start:3716 stop:3934 length:219 start_codon:yes stop_codon:yes gene_type:complete
MRVRDVLALNLKGLRQIQNLSQEDLADLAGIDRTYVSSLERSQYSATIDVLERLALALGVKPADLLTEPASN